MRNSGSYQLVSEHSILSARRENRYAAGGAPRTRSERLEAWVRQIGIARESDCCHDGNTTAPDFKVYDRGRSKIEGANSRQIREEEERLEHHMDSLEHRVDSLEHRVEDMQAKLEEIKRCIRLLSKPEERSETEELEKEEGIKGSSGFPLSVIAKTGDEISISNNREPPNDQVTTEAQREEEFPEDSSSQTPHSGETMAAALAQMICGKFVSGAKLKNAMEMRIR